MGEKCKLFHSDTFFYLHHWSCNHLDPRGMKDMFLTQSIRSISLVGPIEIIGVGNVVLAKGKI